MNQRKWIVWLAGACLLILVSFLAFRIYGYYRLQGAAALYQKEVGSLQPADNAPPKVAETENAAIVLQGGAYATVMNTEERTFLRDLTEKPLEQWDAGSITRARGLIERNEAAFQVLAKSIPLEKSCFNLKYEMAWDLPIPNYLTFMQAKHILGARARLQLIDGNLEEALRTMAAEERMAAALLLERVMISHLVGEAAQKDYDRLVQEMLFRADAPMLEAIAKQLGHLRTANIPLRRIFAAEGTAGYATNRERYAVDEGNKNTGGRLPRWLYLANKRLFLAHILEAYADLAEASDRPFAKEPARTARPAWMPRQIVEDAFSLSDMYQGIARVQGADSELILAELAVKVRLAGMQAGAYPHDLSGFKAEDSPYSGEPVRYTLQPDGSAELAYPEADRSWDRTNKGAVPRKPLFAWKLPKM